MGKYFCKNSLTIFTLFSSMMSVSLNCYATNYQARKDFNFFVTQPRIIPGDFPAPLTMSASNYDTLSVNTPLPGVVGITDLGTSGGTATVRVINSGTSSIFVTSGTLVSRTGSGPAILCEMSGGALTITNNGTITYSGQTAISSAVTNSVAVNINNANSIVGNVNLSGGTGSVSGSITQTGSGNINGNVTFGASTYALSLFGSGNVTGTITGNSTSATISYSSSSPITLPGTITNMHNISVASGTLTLNGTTALSNSLTVSSGSLTLGNTISGAATTSNSGTINNNVANAFALTGTLTNNAGSNFNINNSLTRANTTNHSGTITIASGQTFTNTGVFNYVSSGSGVITGAGNFTNNAFLNFDSLSPSANAMAFTGTFTNTSNFTLSRSLTRAGPTTNSGNIDIGPGRTFTNISTFTQSAGTIYDSGTFVNQNVFNMNGGTITSAFDNQYVVNVNSSFTTNASFTNSLSASAMNVFINFIPGVAFTHNGIINVQNTAIAKFTAPTSFVSTGTINVNGTGSVAGALVGGTNSVLNIGFANNETPTVNTLTTASGLTVNNFRTITLQTSGSQLNVASGFGISGLNTQFTVGSGTTASLSAAVSGTATTTNNGTINNNVTSAFALSGKLTNNGTFNVVDNLTLPGNVDHTGSIAISSGKTLTNNSTFTYVSTGSGAMTGAGGFTNNATVTFNSTSPSANALGFSGTFTNSSTGTLNVNENLTRPNATTNAGLILIASGKTFTNSGSMTISTTTGKIKDIITNGNFTNSGTLTFDTVTPATDALGFTGTFTNTGTLAVNQNLTRANATIFNGTSIAIAASKTFTNSGTFTHTSGAVSGAGTLTNSGTYAYNGGSIGSIINNQGTMHVSAAMSPAANSLNSGVLNVNTGVTFTIPTGFVFTGTINLNGSGTLANAANLANNTNAILNLGTSSTVGATLAAATFTTGAALSGIIQFQLLNGSTLTISSGNATTGVNGSGGLGLKIVNGIANINSSFSGNGAVTLESSSATLNLLSGSTLSMTGGITTNAGTINIETASSFDFSKVTGAGNTGTINLNRATIASSGALSGAAGSKLNIGTTTSGSAATATAFTTPSTITGIRQINLLTSGTVFTATQAVTSLDGVSGVGLTIGAGTHAKISNTFSGTGTVNIANTGTLSLLSGASFSTGAITNNSGGIINVESVGFNATLVTGASNAGKINVNGSGTFTGALSGAAGSELAIGTTTSGSTATATTYSTVATISNIKKISTVTSGSIFNVNNAITGADGVSSLGLSVASGTKVNIAASFTGTGQIVNAGTINLLSGGTLNLSGGINSNTGTINLNGTGVFTGPLAGSAGSILNIGTTTASGVSAAAATFSTTSTIAGVREFNLITASSIMNIDHATTAVEGNGGNTGLNVAAGTTANIAANFASTTTGKITNAGTINLLAGGTLNMAGGINTNTGTINFNSTGAYTGTLAGGAGSIINIGKTTKSGVLNAAATVDTTTAIAGITQFNTVTSGSVFNIKHALTGVSGTGTDSIGLGVAAGTTVNITNTTAASIAGTGLISNAGTIVIGANGTLNMSGGFFAYTGTIKTNSTGAIIGTVTGGVGSVLNIGDTVANSLATSATLSITGVQTIALVTSGSQLTVASTFPILSLDTQFTVGIGSTAIISDLLSGNAATTNNGTITHQADPLTSAGFQLSGLLTNNGTFNVSTDLGRGTNTTNNATFAITSTKTFTNAGTFTASNGSIINGAGGIFVNSGTLTFNSTTTSTTGLGFTGLFTNAGTLTVNQNLTRANATTHTGSISIAASKTFTNDGVFTQDNINSGTSTVSGSGTFSNLVTRTYHFKAGSFTSILNNAGIMNVGGFTDTATLTPANGSSSSGALNINNLAVMTLNSAFSGAGTVTVGNGGVLTIAAGGSLGGGRSFINNGSLNLADNFNITTFTGATFTNTGSIFVTKSGTPITGNIPSGGSNLTIGQDSTGNITTTTFATGGTINIASISVIGSSTFTADHAISGVSSGFNIASSSGAAAFNSGSTYNGTGFVNNSGTLTIKTSSFTAPIQNMAGATLVLNGATTNSAIDNPPSANFNVTGVSANTGNIINHGIMNLTAAFTNTGTTTSDGTLTVAAAFTNSGGNIINNNIMTVTAAMPGNGTIVNNKTLNINAAVTIANPINNTTNGTVTINNAATINGITGNTGIVRILSNISSNDPIVNDNQMTIAGDINFISGAFNSTARSNVVTFSGSRTINASYTNNGSNNFTITNETTFDQLKVTGAGIIDLDHGIINITSTFGGQGNINQTYNFPIIDGHLSSGSAPLMSNEPDTINLPASTLLSTWSSSTNATTGVITISYVRSSYLSHALGTTNYAMAQIIEQISAGTPNTAQVQLINAINSATTTAQFNANLGLLVPNLNATAPLITTQSAIFNKIETRIAAVRDDRNPAMTTGFTAGDLNPDTSVWMGSFGSLATKRVNNSNPGYKARTTGVLLGVDTREFTKDILGVAIGFSNSRVTESSNQNFSTAIHGYHGMIYGTHPFKDSQFFDYLATGSFNKSSGTRRVVIGGTNLTPFATFTGYQAGLRFNYGKSYNFGDYFKITPLGSFQYTFLHQPNYSETGGAAALNISGKPNRNIATIGFGSKVGFDNDDWWLVGSRELRAMVTYDVANARRITTANFVAGGPAFSFLECPARVALKLGVDMVFDIMQHLHIQVNYDFELRHKYTDHTAMMKLRYLF